MELSPSDAQLLERWASGDTESGGELSSRYFASIFRFFHRRLPTAAEDLTQETFLGAIEARDRLRQMSSFRAYLYGIARNRLLMYLRAQRAHVEANSDVALEEPSPSAIFTQHREQKLLVRALRTLPIELQLVCEMFYWEGLKAREIGEVLGAPTSTITTRLAKARLVLKERVEQLAVDADQLDTSLHNIEAWARSLVAPVTTTGSVRQV